MGKIQVSTYLSEKEKNRLVEYCKENKRIKAYVIRMALLNEIYKEDNGTDIRN